MFRDISLCISFISLCPFDFGSTILWCRQNNNNICIFCRQYQNRRETVIKNNVCDFLRLRLTMFFCVNPIYLSPGYTNIYFCVICLRANNGLWLTSHTKAPAGLSQPARCFPESRLRAVQPQFSWGSTIITAVPLFSRFVCDSQIRWDARVSMNGRGAQHGSYRTRCFGMTDRNRCLLWSS